MENPATWNECIKTLNNVLNYGNDLPLTTDKVLQILIVNDFLIGEGKINPNNTMIREAINRALISFDFENKNQCCGGSIGNKIYFSLKPLGVVE